jgi:MoaA/NifB/PqqE/SkfB family radical SAM enzyme
MEWPILLLPTRFIPLISRPEYVFNSLIRKASGQRLLELSLILDLPISEARRYVHSLLFFGEGPDYEFSSSKCVDFRVPYLRRKQTVPILLPEEVSDARAVRVRIDPAPGAGDGSYRILRARFRDEGQDHELTGVAHLEELKDRTRRAVESSEAEMTPVCDHYPSSLSLELTARCNFACPFCHSHGTPSVKAHSNRIEPLTIERLDQLAAEVFPSLTSLCLVGRGEPTLVSDELWSALIGHVVRHRVLVSLVTNGSLIKRRITEELLPWLDSVEFSIDGATEETLSKNRVGGSLPKLLEGLQHFHEMRLRSNLARMPRLVIGFIAKRNNIAELPDLVRAMLPYMPDRFTVRHLLVFFEKEQSESLLGHEDFANPYLQEAYDLLTEHGIRTDCAPLMKKHVEEPSGNAASAEVRSEERAETIDGCMFIHRTASMLCDGDVPTCPIPYIKSAGKFGTASSFLEIWNGPVLQDVRGSFGTASEWEQCGNCFYRECRYKSQRKVADARQARFDLTKGSVFTSKSWDYRKHHQS